MTTIFKKASLCRTSIECEGRRRKGLKKLERRNIFDLFNMDHLPYLLYDLLQRSPCKLYTDQAVYNSAERHYKH
jgi:hypothetical protein